MSFAADTAHGSPSERIKRCAFNAERLVAVLSTLADRIDQAKANGNQELVDHYSREFQKASLKFMGNVEALLDDYYLIKGKRRSRIANEPLEPSELEEIYASVKAMIDLLPQKPAPEDSLEPPRKPSLPKGRLDVKG
ncbi:MAG: hypothetical protein N2315_06145 [Thermanaerothrix sp.]|nr:hypothetical protein [Thermanaerothrix sp.]